MEDIKTDSQYYKAVVELNTLEIQQKNDLDLGKKFNRKRKLRILDTERKTDAYASAQEKAFEDNLRTHALITDPKITIDRLKQLIKEAEAAEKAQAEEEAAKAAEEAQEEEEAQAAEEAAEAFKEYLRTIKGFADGRAKKALEEGNVKSVGSYKKEIFVEEIYIDTNLIKILTEETGRGYQIHLDKCLIENSALQILIDHNAKLGDNDKILTTIDGNNEETLKTRVDNSYTSEEILEAIKGQLNGIEAVEQAKAEAPEKAQAEEAAAQQAAEDNKKVFQKYLERLKEHADVSDTKHIVIQNVLFDANLLEILIKEKGKGYDIYLDGCYIEDSAEKILRKHNNKHNDKILITHYKDNEYNDAEETLDTLTECYTSPEILKLNSESINKQLKRIQEEEQTEEVFQNYLGKLKNYADLSGTKEILIENMFIGEKAAKSLGELNEYKITIKNGIKRNRLPLWKKCPAHIEITADDFLPEKITHSEMQQSCNIEIKSIEPKINLLNNLDRVATGMLLVENLPNLMTKEQKEYVSEVASNYVPEWVSDSVTLKGLQYGAEAVLALSGSYVISKINAATPSQIAMPLARAGVFYAKEATAHYAPQTIESLSSYIGVDYIGEKEQSFASTIIFSGLMGIVSPAPMMTIGLGLLEASKNYLEIEEDSTGKIIGATLGITSVFYSTPGTYYQGASTIIGSTYAGDIGYSFKEVISEGFWQVVDPEMMYSTVENIGEFMQGAAHVVEKAHTVIESARSFDWTAFASDLFSQAANSETPKYTVGKIVNATAYVSESFSGAYESVYNGAAYAAESLSGAYDVHNSTAYVSEIFSGAYESVYNGTAYVAESLSGAYKSVDDYLKESVYNGTAYVAESLSGAYKSVDDYLKESVYNSTAYVSESLSGAYESAYNGAVYVAETISQSKSFECVTDYKEGYLELKEIPECLYNALSGNSVDEFDEI